MSTASGMPENMTILTDHRNHTYYSQHVAFLRKIHQVIDHQVVTKAMERSSQKHVAFGATKMYKDFDRQDIHIHNHVHDRNMSVNKIIHKRELNNGNKIIKFNTNER